MIIRRHKSHLMSLEDFTRELQGKPPRNRDTLDRWAYSDEDGCSYDREAFVTPLSMGIGVAFFGGLFLVDWASGGTEWQVLRDAAAWLWGLFG